MDASPSLEQTKKTALAKSINGVLFSVEVTCSMACQTCLDAERFDIYLDVDDRVDIHSMACMRILMYNNFQNCW